MYVSDNPPFPRGEYLANDGNDQLEGQEYYFPDHDFSDVGVKAKRSERLVKVRVVRNTSGGALLPRSLVRFEEDGLEYGARVDGKVTTTAGRGYPVDEFLPSTGVPDGYLFYIVVEGPAECLTSLAGDGENVISVGGVVVGLTAATSGATTAGRVIAQDLTGATANLANQIQNRVGRALSAKTTANTNAAVLIDVGKW